jgi:hypothetical protein
VLHLHRLQHNKHRPGLHRSAGSVLDRHDHTGKRSAQTTMDPSWSRRMGRKEPTR